MEKARTIEQLPERLLVVGCCGAGKSTLAAELSRRWKLPLIHLDRLWWLPGWRERDPASFDAELARLLETGRWVIDGNYARTLPLRLRRAELVIWLDFSRARCLWQVGKRLLRFYGEARPDIAPGCPERLNFEFLRFVWNFRRNARPRLEQVLEERPAECRLLVFRTPAELKFWLERVRIAEDGHEKDS